MIKSICDDLEITVMRLFATTVVKYDSYFTRN